MAFALQLCSYLLWFPLSVLTISAVLRVGVRRYPLVFAYLIVTFLIAIVQAPALVSYFRAQQRHGEWYMVLYSVGEGITYVLILAIVISLIYQASSRFGHRHIVRLALIAGGFVFIATSFLVHYDSHVIVGVWMTPWTRDLNFLAAVLDMALWLLLLSWRDRDPRLLLLTSGMGVMFAGGAIADAIRHMAISHRSNRVFLIGNFVMVLADTAFLYIWWQAFRKEPVQTKAMAGRR